MKFLNYIVKFSWGKFFVVCKKRNFRENCTIDIMVIRKYTLLSMTFLDAHSSSLQGLCFSISGENLTSRLRSESFYTIMRQEMAWFDSKLNSSSELVIRLATDASKVQEASGMRLGSIVEVGVGMIAAIIIAFVYSWALALLILPCIPIILIGGLLEVKIVAGSGGKSKKDLERAGKVRSNMTANMHEKENFIFNYGGPFIA